MNIERGRGQNHLLSYAALPLALGVATAVFALLGSSLPNHIPSPFASDKAADPTFPARDQPE